MFCIANYIEWLILIISSLNVCQTLITEKPFETDSSYGRWGHYDNYDTRNRPLEPNNPYDRRYDSRYGHTVNPNRRVLIEDPGDTRCKDAIHQGLEEFVTVNTLYGNVVGRIVYLCDGPGVPLRDRPPSKYDKHSSQFRPIRDFWRNVTTFLGIPYARPPTRENNLRFKQTQPPLQWGSILADRYRDSCPQYIRYTGKDFGIPMTDEDCLYLNIFTPWASSTLRELYPVMVYIHGGFFDHGSGNTFPGHMLAASQEVVVVTFNYRLGLLGFLATADNASAGNFGLLDQVQAINWVRENIKAFNGDPERLTLFGVDSGAASAALLALSPLTQRYIKRVIAQSGAAVADWAFVRDPLFMRNTSVVAGYTFGCRTRHTYNLVECLKSRSAIDFTTNEVKPDVGWLPWGPVVDRFTRNVEHQVIPELPEHLLFSNKNKFDSQFAYMSGLTRDEGSAFVFADEKLKLNNYVITEEIMEKKIREYVNIYNYTLDQDSLVKAIKFMYSPWSDPHNLSLIRQGYIDMLTDSWFTAGNDKMVKLMVENSVKTYMYVLNYTIQGLNLPDWIGVPHDTEYLLASGAPFMDSRFFPSALHLEEAKWTESDRNMSQLMLELWANFAKYPNCIREDQLLCGPTPYALFNTILWKPMQLKNLQYLSINSTNYTEYWHINTLSNNNELNAWSTSNMWRDYRQKFCQFWNDYIASIIGKIPPTWPPTYEPFEEELRIYRAATWSVLAALIVLLSLTLLCSCLYCRAKSYRYGDAAIDDYIDIPDIATMGTQYSAPSTRANSESNLSYFDHINHASKRSYMEVINGGRFDFDDGGTYCGGWNDGKAHGHGICTGPKGQGQYSGSWHYGFEVSGVYKWPSGANYEGQWQNGKRHGLGVEYRGKWVYRGEWTQGYKGRYGVRASLMSTAKYEGTWANGLQDGYGSETYADSGSYQGQWLRGMRHGYGVRSSAPYGHSNITKTIVTSATNASLQSLDTEGESQIDNKRETVRGGFVLVARNSIHQKRRNSLVEKSSNISDIIKKFRIRKQRSTGDIDMKSNKSNTPSLVSSTESGSATSFKDTDQDGGSNASFLSQNGDISDPSTTETYMGEWKNDKRCGFGICERSDGLRYEGEWYNNKKYGYGITIFRDGTREEGKYKNNQLIANVRKKHLFVIRSSKVRERIESAVLASHRAQQIALQKADIAISRTATARGKGEQADICASAGRNDSQVAFITAKQYGGADISQSHSNDAPLRRRLSDFSQIKRITKEQQDSRNIAQQQQQKQFLDPNEPFGGRRGSFRSQQSPNQFQNQFQNHPQIPPQLSQQIQQQLTQQLFNQQLHNSQSPKSMIQQPNQHIPHMQHMPHIPVSASYTPKEPHSQVFSDHFDQYRTLVTKYSNLHKQRSIDEPVFMAANQVSISSFNKPLVESPLTTQQINASQQSQQTPDSGISLEECLNRRANTTISNINESYDNSGTVTPSKQWRTASLYRPTATQNPNLLSAGTSQALKRKPSLQPNVVKQVNKPIMSREEVSVLSHQRREQQRLELEMREKLAKNPFLYLFNPQFKNWLNRQQLVMLVLIINISLAILFFKLLI